MLTDLNIQHDQIPYISKVTMHLPTQEENEDQAWRERLDHESAQDPPPTVYGYKVLIDLASILAKAC